MNKSSFFSMIVAVIVGIFMIPLFAVASNNPTIDLLGAKEITISKAVATVIFATDETLDVPAKIYVEYTDRETGNTQITGYATELAGESTLTFWMENLEQGHNYDYRAVMKYDGTTIKTEKKVLLFGKTSSTTTQSHSTTNTTNQSIVTVSSPISSNQSRGSIFGISSATTDLQKKIMTGGVESKNGVAIAITNEQARVDQEDIFTYTVRYQNGRTTSLQNAKLVIKLPDAYEFVSSSVDFDYNTKTNEVSYTIGRVPANSTKSLTFKARAIGESSGDIKTTAIIYFEGGSLSVSDRDSYHAGATSVLGASVFGAGFFPQTLTGWMIIIGLIMLVIIIARRYMTTPIEPQKTA